ncbi:unnamed protein product [Citrullus colocynthis]|uniref:Uncharacterized protein n=1 Tax=Citrullus colocynthis TaxID=252529 RepID=A0ABP0Y4X6_9ROSI
MTPATIPFTPRCGKSYHLLLNLRKLSRNSSKEVTFSWSMEHLPQQEMQQNSNGGEQACGCESGVATMWNELRGEVLAWSVPSDSGHESETCARRGSRLEAKRRHGAS